MLHAFKSHASGTFQVQVGSNATARSTNCKTGAMQWEGGSFQGKIRRAQSQRALLQ